MFVNECSTPLPLISLRQVRDQTTLTMKITLLLAFFGLLVVDNVQSEDCCIVKELFKLVEKSIRQLIPEKKYHDIYCGCAKAFVLGDSSKCDPKKFKLPQAKICEDVVNHVDLKKKCKEHNILGFKSLIENAIYSNGGDADEICEKMPVEGDKFLAKAKKLMSGGPDEAKAAYEKFCKKEDCTKMKEIPKEVEDYVLKDMAPCFKDFFKIIKNTLKAKTMPAIGAASQGVELMFGGGDFGIKVSKCLNEVITIATKFGQDVDTYFRAVVGG
uniref:Uncharacterized protein n=1 Tax=Strigamia maritima TaxID=126957 RepID=T1JBD0_STRMM